MWCSTCQQDVPALASPEDRKVRCAKCRKELAARSAGEDERDMDDLRYSQSSTDVGGSEEVPAHAFFERPPFDMDTWQWDELREARRLVRSFSNTSHDERQLDASNSHREGLTTLGREIRPALPLPAVKRNPQRTRRFSFFSWAALSLGVMAFVFGAVLLAWSFVMSRPDLWTLGLPFAIGGQAALVLGLVLQMDGLWQSNHEAAETLSELDEQLIEIRRATSQLSSSHSGPGQSFYFHLAEGCSPHMLLADLKGQLDLLAMRLADNR